MRQTHYFLALPLPEPIRKVIEEWRESIKQHHSSFKTWVHPEDYHLTLVFLGYVPPNNRMELIANMQILVENYEQFCLELSSIGTFGNKEAPRILWVGVNPNETLLHLQKAIATMCNNIGLMIDSRPYNPHITLARRWIKEESYSKSILKEYDKLSHESISFTVKNTVLYQSHHDRNPKYAPISIFSFGKEQR